MFLAQVGVAAASQVFQRGLGPLHLGPPGPPTADAVTTMATAVGAIDAHKN